MRVARTFLSLFAVSFMRFIVHLEYADDARERIRDALKLTGAKTVRIVEVKGEAAEGPLKPDNVPTCPIALAVAALFGRKPDQEWSETEIRLFKDARRRQVLTIETMTIISTYYKAERKKGNDQKTGGIHRRDLKTFLGNSDGELDRAMAHSQRKTGHGSGQWGDSSVTTQMPLLRALPSPESEQEPSAEQIEEARKRLQG